MVLIGRREPMGRAATWFNVLVGAAGLLLLLAATLGWLHWDPPPFHWPLGLTFLCLFILARLLRFEIPPNITASLIVPLQLAAVVLLGAVPTAWLVVPAFLVEVFKERALSGLSGARRRAVLGIIAFNLGMEVLVTFAAAATWLALVPGGELDGSLRGLAALVLTFLAFKAVNEAFMVGGSWLRGVSIGDYVAGARTTVVIETLTLPLAALLILIHQGLDRTPFYLFVAGIALAAFVVRSLTRARAELSAANVDLQRANADLERKVREVETLADIGRAISADIELEGLLETIHERVAQILDANHFYIALHENDEDELSVPYESIRGERQPAKRIPLGEGLTSHVVLSRRPLLIRNLVEERVFLPAEPLTVDDRPNRSWLGVPMVARGECVGAIVLQDARPAAHDEDDLRVLTAIASQAAISVKNARLHQEAMHALRVEAENRELKRLNAKKSDFVNMVAHQFRTPLNTVIGYTSLLVDRLQSGRDLGSELERHLRTVHGESRRLDAMVEELLNLSRIRAGRLPLTMQRFDLDQLVTETLESHQLLARETDHELLQQHCEGGGASVVGDSNFVRQAIANLVANACKYAPKGTAITVATSSRQDCVVVQVVDAGPGVPEADVEKVFDEFYRAAGKTADRPGTGLGLSIARGIVEAHGGRTWAERRGAGSAFCLELPKRPAAESGETRPSDDASQADAGQAVSAPTSGAAGDEDEPGAAILPIRAPSSPSSPSWPSSPSSPIPPSSPASHDEDHGDPGDAPGSISAGRPSR